MKPYLIYKLTAEDQDNQSAMLKKILALFLITSALWNFRSQDIRGTYYREMLIKNRSKWEAGKFCKYRLQFLVDCTLQLGILASGKDFLGILINYEIFGIPKNLHPKKFTDKIKIKSYRNLPAKKRKKMGEDKGREKERQEGKEDKNEGKMKVYLKI
ncbi:hypothetical protein RhiirC2_704975 [Rhizophagus irregularis]|uniref:Uncharacterized protein n=1 Tax=Rhizophagus irregularis TaxID=588596 RepID=A0A2N1NZZ4_9GLOM|nr:hypothetical protein RhiirC2_704975 [Rhizophagus irregularis]